MPEESRAPASAGGGGVSGGGGLGTDETIASLKAELTALRQALLGRSDDRARLALVIESLRERQDAIDARTADAVGPDRWAALDDRLTALAGELAALAGDHDHTRNRTNEQLAALDARMVQIEDVGRRIASSLGGAH